MSQQEFTGWFGAMHRAVMRCANLVSTPDSPVRRALSPAYSTLQYALTGGRGVAAEINGDIYRIDPRFRWRLQPAYEADLAGFLRARVKPGQCCIDVGANIGIYVMQMSRWTAGGHIVAFEPNPRSLEVVARHVRMNGLGDTVTLVPAAAGREEGSARLFDVEPGSGLSRLGAANPAIQGVVDGTAVRVTTIDAWCRASGVRPDWILIDVEGYEFDVLAGARDTIRQCRPGVVVELHPHLYPDGTATELEGRRLLAALQLRPVPVGDPDRDPWSVGAVSLEPA